MGKFSDALKKAESLGRQGSTKLATEKVRETPHPEIEAFRLETNQLEVPCTPSPLVAGRIDHCLVSLLEPSTPAAECFKILRAKLLFNQNGKCCRTIMVSSPQTGDGKTLVAANLAVSLAQGLDEHVILLDCDLRRPMLHQTFGLDIRRGLREYLDNGNCVSPYLQKTPVQKLTLLPAGDRPGNPSELLSSGKMRNLIEELKARYDDRYIIIDSPPALYAAEGNSLASMVDGVLLIVRSKKTPKELLLQMADNIGREKILGVVFNADKGSIRDHRQLADYYG